ncbi:response regulator transcription factor [Permianibacter sp. IMCC34836]|uniref:response regulator transcription factor n=1 Tax=Permianibacter fluminis TaxID=2738515 RepID=UPI001553130C|nr:response regulator transcription factor [Permianibacter fluminis]NQD37862.1 response regulator transcription factor [Permianibacter fluminis]
MSYRFLIADDHPLFRAALRQALSAVASDAGIEEAESLSKAKSALLASADFDLVLLDLGLPDSEGFTGLMALRHQHPSVGVAIVSAQEDVVVMRQAIALGAVAYIPKSEPLPSIVEAIRTALNGHTWLPQSAKELSGNPAEAQLAERIASLSPQQYRVLCMVADGKLNKQIAAELEIQETTIKQHVSAILRKLGLINRTQAGVLLRSLQQGGRLQS